MIEIAPLKQAHFTQTHMSFEYLFSSYLTPDLVQIFQVFWFLIK